MGDRGATSPRQRSSDVTSLLPAQLQALQGTPSNKRIGERHEAWRRVCPTRLLTEMHGSQDASAHAAASVANNEGKTICHAAACGSGSQHGSQRSLLVSWHSEVATPPHGA